MGWLTLKPGEQILAVKKCMGLKKGEKREPLCVLRVVRVRREQLKRMLFPEKPYGERECEAEGFPAMRPIDFIAFYCKANKCEPEDFVTRIEFEYV